MGIMYQSVSSWRGGPPEACISCVNCRFLFISLPLLLLANFKLQYEDDYKYEFSVLSSRFRFGGRKFSKCACSELNTRSRSRTPIWRSLLFLTRKPFKPRRVCGIALVRGIRFQSLFHTGVFLVFRFTALSLYRVGEGFGAVKQLISWKNMLNHGS